MSATSFAARLSAGPMLGADPSVVGRRFTAYVSDRFFSGGATWALGNDDIAGTDADEVYRSERYGDFSYAIPLADGAYSLRLQFAEIYWTDDGMRVWIDGKLVGNTPQAFSHVGLVNAAWRLAHPESPADQGSFGDQGTSGDHVLGACSAASASSISPRGMPSR